MSIMRRMTGTAMVIAAGAGFAGCSLPPVTTSEQSITVPYNTIIPAGLTSPLGLPGFSDKQGTPSTFPVPGEARNVKLASVNLNLKMQNTGPIPLRIKLYLAAPGTDVYSTTPLGGEGAQIDLPANGGTAQHVYAIDPALLKNEQIQLGYTFGSPGTSEPVTFTEDDKVVVTHSVSAAVKLF